MTVEPLTGTTLLVGAASEEDGAIAWAGNITVSRIPMVTVLLRA